MIITIEIMERIDEPVKDHKDSGSVKNYSSYCCGIFNATGKKGIGSEKRGTK